MLSIFTIRSSDNTIPPWSGMLPPAVPVPLPLGVIGILYRLHNETIATTSSVVIGKTTASGGKIFRLLSYP